MRQLFFDFTARRAQAGPLPLFGQVPDNPCHCVLYLVDLYQGYYWQSSCKPFKRHMLKITMHDSAGELRFRLEGRLCGPWVNELRQCWQTATSTTEGRRTVLDLLEVDFVDSEGQALMADMSSRGVRLLAVSPLILSLIEEISPASGCGTVEEKPARRTDAFASVITSGRDPRTL